MTWWVLARAPGNSAAIMGMRSFVLTFVPAIATASSIFQWGKVKLLSQELLLPVERKNYIRQLARPLQ